jgi:secreted trypsin-like serine protease
MKMNICVSFTLILLLISLICQIRGQGRIVGGKNATISTLPFAVHISFQKKNARSLCTGSLISLEWVLSAAHCYPEQGYTNVYTVSIIHNTHKQYKISLEVKIKICAK